MSEWQETVFGKAPGHWKIETIGALSEKVTDGSHFSPKPCPVGKYMCSVKDMTYDRFDLSNCKLISQNDFDKLVIQGCKPGKNDILISKDGANCLDLIFVFDQEEDLVLLSSIAIVRLLPDINSKFVRYFLLSPACQFIMRNNFVSGSAIPRVVLKDFKKVPVLLPSLPEQKAIASVLSSLDDKIELLHRQNKTLESMAEMLFRQWFVEEAQENWEEETLSSIAEHKKINIRPDQHPETIYNHYSIPAFDDGKHPVKEMGSEIRSNKYQVIANSILISKLNPRFPRVWAISDLLYDNSISSTEFQVVFPIKPEYYGFIYCFLKSKQVTGKLIGAASGTSGSHQRVKPEDVFNLKFQMPNKQTIYEFNMINSENRRRIANNMKQIRTLEKLRDTLLPKLMNGDVRVEHKT